jgi:hypothetical protein
LSLRKRSPALAAERNPVKAKGPTKRQLKYLRSLATSRGESFTYPTTTAEASHEIERLLDRRPSSYTERRIEREEDSRDEARRGDAASVRDFETTGYGSSARWVGGER